MPWFVFLALDFLIAVCLAICVILYRENPNRRYGIGVILLLVLHLTVILLAANYVEK